ncbi:PAS domain-containing sensor histidine kinase [Hymenobacter canadensis]|uniref:histidine kinase n=1 Tax=Hymenobacter canadensis TaxID=2999067 RepID=A0ABY7LU68_9BACT|nr:PAS domain-containing protein [Hymenobacter canadensis]WBA43941.1 PAS domain-containing protein [Hymenobacter canadensis]
MTLASIPGLPATTLPVLLDLLPNGILYYTPVLNKAGEVVDFQFAYLNAAAQRLLALPARPIASYLQQWPDTVESGVFAFHRDTYLAGVPAQRDQFYQADEYDILISIQATRLDDGLLVSFTSDDNLPRTTVEEALRASQAREQVARTEAERQRGELERVFEQAPLAIAVYRGPNYVIELANSTVCRLWGRTPEQIVGKGLFEALPEVAGMGYEELLDGVMATGVPHVAQAMAAQHDRNGSRETVYWDFVYVPMREADGRITGAMVVANEVTEQVLARQQVQQLNEELEMRVTARSAEARAALHDAESQREQLWAQQALLGQILGQVPACIATFSGPAHRLSFFNTAYQQLVGGRAVLGKSLGEVLPETIEQGYVALLDQVYATGQPYHGTEIAIMLAQPTGSAIQQYLNFTYQPLNDAQGQCQGLLAFAVDVTEQVLARKQAETLQAGLLAAMQRQARQRQDLYQIFEQTPAAIVLLREPDHRIDYFNPAFEELFPPEEWTGSLHGRTLAEVYPRLKMAGLVNLIDRVFETGEPQVVLEMALAELQPGSPRYVTFAYQAYREDDRIVGVAAFVYDVSEQVLARQEREARQQELQRIFEQAPVAIAILRGPDLVIELANAAVGDIWGRHPAQVLGRPYFEALPDSAGQGFEAILARVLQTGEGFTVTETPLTLDRADTGRPALGYVNFEFQPLYDEQARVSGVIAIGIEVTDQVLARQQVQILNEEMQATNLELADTNRRLTRTNTDLDTFVYTASHDLKAPISNIEGLLLALRQQLPPATLQADLVPRLLEMMEDSVARFQQTIGHLTDISQLQQTEDPETVDLPVLINGVRLDLAPLLDTAPVVLAVDVDGCRAVRVAPKTLRSVVYNLLSNAVKYRDYDRPAQVQLRAHCTPGHLVLAVQDNGLGLTEAQQGELFGMFRRLHTHVDGSGVGLFTVKRLVDNAGGTIIVESQPGVGSTFTVSLPA